jgi:peroxiredoxin Q/BCP
MTAMTKFKPVSILIVCLLFSPIILSAKEGSMPLKVGTIAPDFTMESSDGDTVSLHDFKGKNSVVLIFYPGDQTPGCTKQLCAIRDDYSQFQEKNAKVFGVNPADKKSHKAFVEKQKYQFPLLVDESGAVAKLYDCGGWPGLKRTVYVIDTNGTIVFAERGMPTDAEILKAIPAK